MSGRHVQDPLPLEVPDQPAPVLDGLQDWDEVPTDNGDEDDGENVL